MAAPAASPWWAAAARWSPPMELRRAIGISRHSFIKWQRRMVSGKCAVITSTAGLAGPGAEGLAAAGCRAGRRARPAAGQRGRAGPGDLHPKYQERLRPYPAE